MTFYTWAATLSCSTDIFGLRQNLRQNTINQNPFVRSLTCTFAVRPLLLYLNWSQWYETASIGGGRTRASIDQAHCFFKAQRDLRGARRLCSSFEGESDKSCRSSSLSQMFSRPTAINPLDYLCGWDLAQQLWLPNLRSDLGKSLHNSPRKKCCEKTRFTATCPAG